MENQYLIREVFGMLQIDEESLGKNLTRPYRDCFQISRSDSVSISEDKYVKPIADITNFGTNTLPYLGPNFVQDNIVPVFAKAFPNKVKRDFTLKDISKLLRENLEVAESISIQKLYQKIFQNIFHLCFSEEEKSEMTWAKEKSLANQVIHNSTVARKVSSEAYRSKALFQSWISVSLFSDFWDESIVRGLVTPALFVFHNPLFTDFQSHSQNKIEVQSVGHSKAFRIQIDPNLLEEQTAQDISIQVQKIVDEVYQKLRKTQLYFWSMISLKYQIESNDFRNK